MQEASLGALEAVLVLEQEFHPLLWTGQTQSRHYPQRELVQEQKNAKETRESPQCLLPPDSLAPEAFQGWERVEASQWA